MGHLRRVIEHDVGLVGVKGGVVLVVGLGRVEGRQGDDLGDDAVGEGLGAIELGDVGVGDALLVGVVKKTADRYCVPSSAPW